MKFGPVDVFFFLGRKYHLSRNSGRRFTLEVPSDIFLVLLRLRTGIINKHVGYIQHEYQQYAWTSSQDASEKDASWFTSFLLK